MNLTFILFLDKRKMEMNTAFYNTISKRSKIVTNSLVFHFECVHREIAWSAFGGMHVDFLQQTVYDSGVKVDTGGGDGVRNWTSNRLNPWSGPKVLSQQL